MLFDKYKNKLDRYILENTTFRIISVILSLVILFLVWIIANKTDSQRVVFMPPKAIAKEFWVAGNEVSKTYIEEISQFIAFNLLNITRENAHNNIENILTLVDPKFYQDVKIKLLEQTGYIVDNSISRTFFITAIDANKKGVVEVHGVIKDIISDKVVNSNNNTLIIGYEINQGRFWINSLNFKKEVK
ncbi:conjugative transfer system protein TraE [Campylobacter subantarcticus LMG 24377]|uniref:Conjugative transfer system protein TraE n=4 Tax=Campylobacter TaxID=194 RepID=A0ABW9N303_9BACT|nr:MULTISPECIES: conjugative transfer system protein TraE [Campylobacter]AJC92164.1 conjugative transfer system protein TraE [Campylobacter subantarcticus LMG 24377]EAH8152214.1 conjugative transfer system protein TraE [Campylobacter lari]EAI4828417.1 conjugative transfer system protein TraE [Campylobacter lari]EAK0438947.1 conjugative transfer system protein TraE [Campylobacter lari]EAK0794073.1 conjugative transfer system protein TraE [Campylobacter lari]